MAKKCKSCGGTKFITAHTSTSGDVSCANCGWVLESSSLVADLQWSENSAGGAVLNGQNIRLDQTSGSNSLKSRDITIMNAKRKINALASALRIPHPIADSAANWFSLALNNNFVKGRKSQNVVAACLYIACRKEKTHHMLVDFSSKLQLSVYSIGSTFLKMVKALNITSLPLTDPSLFIQHFSDRLAFGNKKVKVIRDATKLAHRMSQDWIYEGRRPAGIAGACVLLAARMNNFRRTHDEIIALAHVGEETIRRRLNEFKKTNSSGMSITQFRNTDNSAIKSTLPPVFIKHNEAPTDQAKKKKKIDEFGNTLIERFITSEAAGTSEDIKKAISKLCGDLEKAKKSIETNERDRLRKKEILEEKDEASQKDNANSEMQTKDGAETRESTPSAVIDSDDEAEGINRKEEAEADALLQEIDGDASEEDKQLAMIENNRPRNLVANLPKTNELLAKIPDTAESFSDIDDDEIAASLLSEEESKIKEEIFVNLNGDFLIELEQKRLKQEADELVGHGRPIKRRRNNKTKSESELSAASAAGYINSGIFGGSDFENKAINGALMDLNDKGDFKAATSASMKTMLRSRQASTKLNYNAIDTILYG
ncbi:transcription factor TFIIIB subunit [Saccharomycopsis crataegensis]|uniref:B-related factor 1 n=1 Tax=Saccharomycopsis crataegensis TaxID=43959 RepID=A0AAV5QFY8_9ASCO|nr:transcription factor TFIIIB subunit [Saccharomycopsis crataegensis]